MYVETDFIIGLMKSDDWLTERVHETLDDESADLYTSLLSYTEFLMSAYEPGEGIAFEAAPVVANLLEEVPIRPESDEDAALAAATFLDEYSITPFDAFHAGIAITADEQIHASDQIYDELGLDRLPLEPEGH